MTRYRDLLLVLFINLALLVTLALAEWTVLGQFAPVVWVRLLLGALYIFVVPGYAIQAALLPRSDQIPLLDRMTLSAGLSVAIMPLLGLILDGPPGGIWLWTSAVGLTLITVFFTLVAGVRRFFSAPTAALPESQQEVSLAAWWQAQGGARRWLWGGFAAGVLLVSVLAVYSMLAPHPDELLTEFFVVSPSGVAETYPLRVRVGEPFTLRIGTNSQEAEPALYAVEARQNNSLIASSQPFVLQTGQVHEFPLTISLTSPGQQRLDLWLTRGDQRGYRQIYLWINVVSE
jgi:uncharacterized membrane protein